MPFADGKTGDNAAASHALTNFNSRSHVVISRR
jgi:hypothetical protein